MEGFKAGPTFGVTVQYPLDLIVGCLEPRQNLRFVFLCRPIEFDLARPNREFSSISIYIDVLKSRKKYVCRSAFGTWYFVSRLCCFSILYRVLCFVVDELLWPMIKSFISSSAVYAAWEFSKSLAFRSADAKRFPPYLFPWSEPASLSMYRASTTFG